MGLSTAQSQQLYGTEAYTGWGDVEAGADWKAKGGGSPAPATTGGTAARTATGIDESQVPSTLDYINKLNATEDTAFNDLIMAMKARKSPLDVYTDLENASGLPAMRTGAVSLAKSISDIEGTLETVEPDVAARSRESLMTEAQRRGVVTQRKEPLLESLGKTTTGLGNLKELISLTGTDVSNKANLFMQGQEQEIEPIKLKYTALVDRNARNLSGFTSDKETKLQILMDKLDRQQTLSDQEWSLANSLTADEKDYTRQLREAAAQAGYKVTGSESNEQLLGIIGSKAAEQIAFERAQANKTGSTAATKTKNEQALLTDANKGASLTQLHTKYDATVGFDDVVKLYTGIGYYKSPENPTGQPIEPYAQEILGTRPADSKSTFNQAAYDAYIKEGYTEAAARYMATS